MSFDTDFRSNEQLSRQLRNFNSKWASRHSLFAQRVPPPWWAHGLVLDSDVRQQYENYLPVGEFKRDLHALARCMLPDPDWTPSALKTTKGCGCCSWGEKHASLPDLWQTMSAEFAGKLRFELDEMLPLFCALADPPRFGTDFGRYSQQLDLLRNWLFDIPRSRCRALDLGCGTGQGTWELTALLRHGGVRKPLVTGVTYEPLEAWMAGNRQLPHDLRRAAVFKGFSCEDTPEFVVADVNDMPFGCRHNVDLIICNGLIGGPFLHHEEQIEKLLAAFRGMLRPDGVVTVANHFHDGRVQRLNDFAAAARRNGWLATGSTRLLWLTH